ncbi:hypothetical protein [Natronospira bacteriovora]|uniref:Uncharacterized protein n=1 Tax=Natronospira bacteriovora TaxID=3069753 RepID=A0ABU0W503_9GAMM|nr:hypothetical protein [Natronospira sp. AB-CW4]MDQ2068993.1 hypothetical protein [Natronospira sp. AB-CW4]
MAALGTMMAWLLNLRREIDWQIKQALTWSHPPRKTLARLKDIHDELPAPARARLDALAQRYELSHWEHICNPQEMLESLYVLDLLDRHLPNPEPGPNARTLDIGAKSWPYLPGLYAWQPTAWTGVELDAHLRYIDLTTRRAHGEAMARAHPGCQYRADNVLQLQGQFQLITWFLPFFTPEPLARWGLPQRFFMPERLLKHVYAQLAPNGQLFITHQSEKEANAQATLLDQCKIQTAERLHLESPFAPERGQHPGWLIHKAAEH